MRMIYDVKNGICPVLCSSRFWMAVLVVFFLCLCSNTMGAEAVREDTVVWNMLLHDTREGLYDRGEEYCAYYVIMSFRNMEWFAVLLPLTAAFPFLHNFADEWLTGSYYMCMARQERRHYALVKMSAAAITGCLTMCFGVLLYAAVVTLKFPSYESFHLMKDESMIAFLYGEGILQRLLAFMKSLLHVGMLGGISSLAALLLVTACKDRFFALTIPMMAAYLSTKAANYYLLFVRSTYEWETPPLKIQLLELLIPSMYLNLEQSFRYWFGIPDVFWYGYLLLVMIMLTLVMCRIAERRND